MSLHTNKKQWEKNTLCHFQNNSLLNVNYFLLQSKQYLTRIYTCQETIKQKMNIQSAYTSSWLSFGASKYAECITEVCTKSALVKFLITKQKKAFYLNLNNREHVWNFASNFNIKTKHPWHFHVIECNKHEFHRFTMALKPAAKIVSSQNDWQGK